MMNMVSAGSSLANTDSSDEAFQNLTRIGDMARKYGVTLRALRFYEDKGLLNPVREGTTRLYTHRDRARLKLILLGRKVGFSLREVKHLIDLYDPKGTNVRQLKVTLEKSERQLGRLHKQRETILEAIGDLERLIGDVRNQLNERQSSAA